MRSPASRFASGVAVTAALLCAASPTHAQDRSVFREVRVDLSGLPPGAAETRRLMGACLAQNLPIAFAGRVNPAQRGAPVLVVRPTSVWLAPPPSSSGDDHRGSRLESGSSDYMEGEALVGGRRVPLSVAGGAAPVSPVAALNQAILRTDQLCQSFAYWLARKV